MCECHYNQGCAGLGYEVMLCLLCGSKRYAVGTVKETICGCISGKVGVDEGVSKKYLVLICVLWE